MQNNIYETGFCNPNKAFVASHTSTFCCWRNKKKSGFRLWCILFFLFSYCIVHAQPEIQWIEKGNIAYQKGNYTEAIQYYNKALEINSNNAILRFNLANALEKNKQYAEAALHYSNAIQLANNSSLKANAYYNQGVALAKQNQLAEAIQSFKQSLLLQPQDNDARDNLQKALMQWQQMQKQNSSSTQSKPQPQNPSALDKQMLEQKLAELRNKEKEIQKNMQQKNNQPQQPEKDW